MTDIATLGFSVDTSGLDKASQSTDKLAQSTKNATQASREFNQAQSESDNKNYAIQAAADRLGISYEQQAAKIKAASDAVNNFGKSAAATTGAIGTVGTALKDAGAAASTATASHTALAAAAGGLSREMGGTSAVAKEFRETMHSIDPILRETGASLGGLGGFLSAARAGFTGLAVAITGALIVSLEKARDETRLTLDAFKALAGDQGGKRLFDDTSAAAKRLGASVSEIAPGVMELKRALDSASGIKVIFTDTAAGAAAAAALGRNAVVPFEELVKLFELSGVRAADAATKTSAFFKEVEQGGLTLKAFNMLPPVAEKEIAQAFGVTGPNAVQRFGDALAQQPKTLQQLISALALAKTHIDNDLQVQPTVEQGWDRLYSSVKKLWEEIGNSAAITSVVDMFQKLQGAVETVTKTWETMAHVIEDAGLTSAVSALGSIIQNTLNPVIGLINALTSAWNALKAAISAGMPSGSGSGGSSDSGISAPNMGDPSTNGDYYGSFATGGSFIVGGSGGIDSQHVHFMATPGESITVAPPGSSSNLLNDLQRSISTGSITSPLPGMTTSTVTAPITSAAGTMISGPSQSLALVQQAQLQANTILAQIAANTAATASATSTTAAVATQSPTNPLGATLGAGGVSIAGMPGQSAADKALQRDFGNPTYNQDVNPGPDINSASYGRAGISRSGAAASGSRASGSGSSIIFRSSGSGFSGTSGYVNSGMSNFSTGFDLNQFVNDYYGNGNTTDYNSFYDAVGYNNGGGGYDAGYGTGGTYGDYSGDPNAASYDPYFNSFYDATGAGGGGYDSGYTDYGGDYSFSEYGASGADFVVPGSGGTDSVKGLLHVTPGERVTVTPPGMGWSAGQMPTKRISPPRITINVNGATNPGQFIRSVSALSRAAQRAGL